MHDANANTSTHIQVHTQYMLILCDEALGLACEAHTHDQPTEYTKLDISWDFSSNNDSDVCVCSYSEVATQ